MKIPAAQIEGFLANPDPAIGAVLVYGPDNGLARERAGRLARVILGAEADPFRFAELSATILRDDPARLADEAAALSFTGGRRVVRLGEATDGVADAVEAMLAGSAIEALVIIEAGDLGPRSSLRRVCEGAANAAALPCYADEGGGLEAVIRESLAQRDLRATPDAMAFLAANLGADRMITRNELDKLALYTLDSGEVTLDDAVACVGDNSAMTLEDLAFAAAGGDPSGLVRALERTFQEGTAPVAALRAAMRHLQRLHLAAGLVASGRSTDDTLKGLKPPVFFKREAGFCAQLRLWSPKALAAALAMLTEAEVQCKTTGMPDASIASQALMRLAAQSRAGTRKRPVR